MEDLVRTNKTHNLVRFVKDPKELGRSPLKSLYDKSLAKEVDVFNNGDKLMYIIQSSAPFLE